MNQVIAMWGLPGLLRISLFFFPGEGFSLIQEPLNSLLFLAAGIVLLGVVLVQRWRRKGKGSVGKMVFHSADDFHLLEPDAFERTVAQIFRSMGYDARLTGRRSDHGVDLEIRLAKGEYWIVQCKNWEGSVGEPTIRDLFGVLHRLHADRTLLITSGTFTNQAVQWAKDKPIEPVAGKRLFQLWRSASRAKTV